MNPARSSSFLPGVSEQGIRGVAFVVISASYFRCYKRREELLSFTIYASPTWNAKIAPCRVEIWSRGSRGDYADFDPRFSDWKKKKENGQAGRRTEYISSGIPQEFLRDTSKEGKGKKKEEEKGLSASTGASSVYYFREKRAIDDDPRRSKAIVLPYLETSNYYPN